MERGFGGRHIFCKGKPDFQFRAEEGKRTTFRDAWGKNDTDGRTVDIAKSQNVTHGKYTTLTTERRLGSSD